MLFTAVITLSILQFGSAATKAHPRFTNPLAKNVTVKSGQTAILPCSVDFLGDYKVVWQDHREKILTFEDRRIISDERISIERPYVKEWNLHVREVRPQDAGTYTCQINTNPVQFTSVTLRVNEPAKIIDHLSSSLNVVAREGDKVELVCNVTGLPQPDVTWFRIPTGLKEDEDEPGDEKQVGVEGEVLVIHNVSRYCDDTYKCVAFNGVEPAAYRLMRVRVEFPPEIRLPNKKLGQRRGKTTILECVVTAYPHAMNVWRRHGQVIMKSDSKYSIEVYDEGDNTKTLSLKIQHLSEDDYGEYECVAENQLGRDTETMVLYEYPRYVPTTTTTTVAPTRKPTTFYPIHGVDPNPRGEGRRPSGSDYPEYDSHSSNRNQIPGSGRWPDTGAVWPDSLPQNNKVDGYNSGGKGSSWGEPGYDYNSGQNSVIAKPSNSANTVTSGHCGMLSAAVCIIVSLLRR